MMLNAEGSEELLIVGDSAFAEVAFEYFSRDSSHRVVGFAVERAFLKRETLCGLAVSALEDLPQRFDPTRHAVYVAIVYSQLNRLRRRLVDTVAGLGYRLASFVSPRAQVWPNARIGSHCFIFENNVVQPFVSIGDNVVLWSGNHIGHHSVIEDNVFVSSHVVVSGFAEIGANCFLGVNSSVGNNVRVAADNWVGPGVVINSSTEPNQLFRASEPQVAKVGARRFFKVPG